VLDDKLQDRKETRYATILGAADVFVFRKQPTSQAYWQVWDYLHQKLSWQFHPLYEAVQEAMKQTPRASSLVENLNSTAELLLAQATGSFVPESVAVFPKSQAVYAQRM
jgi:hypothetical protein